MLNEPAEKKWNTRGAIHATTNLLEKYEESSWVNGNEKLASFTFLPLAIEYNETQPQEWTLQAGLEMKLSFLLLMSLWGDVLW